MTHSRPRCCQRVWGRNVISWTRQPLVTAVGPGERLIILSLKIASSEAYPAAKCLVKTSFRPGEMPLASEVNTLRNKRTSTTSEAN